MISICLPFCFAPAYAQPYYPPPVYYAPQPAYYAPAPQAYYAPPIVVVSPRHHGHRHYR